MSKQYDTGTYYVGDLCYFKPIDWTEFCSKTIVDMQCLDGDFEVSGYETWHHGTAEGDGTYEDSSERFTFAVDAGLLGFAKIKDGDTCPDGGHFITFDTPFTPAYVDGVFEIRHLTINTNY